MTCVWYDNTFYIACMTGHQDAVYCAAHHPPHFRQQYIQTTQNRHTKYPNIQVVLNCKSI